MIEGLLRRALSGCRAERVLEVGPGYGSFGRLACQLTGARVLTAIDVDRSVLEWQRREAHREGIAFSAVEAPLAGHALEQLPHDYDVILCQEVLEHLVDAEVILGALSHHLVQSGRFVITVPTALSERWLRLLNPRYMTECAYGHVRQFDEKGLLTLVAGAGLRVLELVPTQPHFFLSHTWTFGMRLPVEESTGRVLATGWKQWVSERLNAYSRLVFVRTGEDFWGRLLPRNYFLVATRP